MSQAPSNPQLGLGVKLSYGVGSIAYGVAGQALSTSIITIYLNQVVGMPAGLVGAAIMLSVIIDAVIDPLIGRWSDNTRSRWGRRHPFMYASAIPVGLAFFMLWHPPAGLSNQTLFAFSLAVMVVVRLFLTAYEIPSAALTPELAPDYHARTTLLSFRQFFGIMGAAVMYVLLYLVFLRKDAAHPLGILNRAGYETWGAIAAVVMVVSILVSSLATHHLIPRLMKARDQRVGVAQAFREIASTVTNPSLMVMMLAGLASGVAGGIAATVSNYFNFYFWGLTPQTLAGLLVFLLPAGIIATLVTPAISRRLGKKRTMLLVLVTQLVSGLTPISLRLMGLMPANGTLALLVILVLDLTVWAFLSVAALVIIATMIADIVEDSAVKTGVRSEGLLFAANGLLPKITGGLGGFIGALLLEAAKFPVHAQPGTVDPVILQHLALLYLPAMGVLNAASIAVLSFYQIDEAGHTRNLALLRETGVIAETALEAAAPEMSLIDEVKV